MEVYRVSFVGQGVIKDEYATRAVLEYFASRLIQEKEHVEFLVGREHRFDELATSAVRRAQSVYGTKNSCLNLMLMHPIANNDFFKEYDNVVYAIPLGEDCDTVQEHRRAMLLQSDLVLGYVTEKSGEAYHALKYAARKNKSVKNVAALIFAPTPAFSPERLEHMYQMES